MMRVNKSVKRLCALVVVAALFIQQIPLGKVVAAANNTAWDGTIASSYQGGNGTADSPYLIADGAQLARLADRVNTGNEAGNYYQLTGDINLGGLDWIPIGNETNPFSGSFDGMGHVIRNMYISGSLTTDSSQNNEMDSVDVRSEEENDVDKISPADEIESDNTSLMDEIDADNSGSANETDSNNSDSVEETDSNNSGSVEETDSDNLGSVDEVDSDSSGSVDEIDSNNPDPVGEIDTDNLIPVDEADSYNTNSDNPDETTVNKDNAVIVPEGLVETSTFTEFATLNAIVKKLPTVVVDGKRESNGEKLSDVMDSNSLSLNNEMDSNKVDSGKTDSDRVDSDNTSSDSANPDNISSDSMDSDNVSSDGADFNNTDSAEMNSDESVVNNDISLDNANDVSEDVTVVPDNLSEAPVIREYVAVSTLNEEELQAEMADIIASATAAAKAGEAVMDARQYSDPAQLQRTQADLTQAEELVESWQSDQIRAKKYRSSSSSQDDVGLFGNIAIGKIINTKVVTSNVYGGTRTGGIVGYSAVGTEIKGCSYDGTIDSNHNGSLGGIIGHADGWISDCYNKGVIGTPSSSILFLGGIAGVATDYIVNCTNTGSVSGNQSYTGGIVGNYNTNKMIKTCFNKGSIGTAIGGDSRLIGGIAGEARRGIISDCANHGTVTGSGSIGFMGGLAGAVGYITKSYNTGNVSGYYAAGLSGSIHKSSLNSYTSGSITGAKNAAITCLLVAKTTVGTTTYWRTGSASQAIGSRVSSATGTPVSVAEYIMKSNTWIKNTLKAPFVPDASICNERYPIHRDIEYNLSSQVTEFITGTFNYSSERTVEKSPGHLEEDYSAVYHYSDEYFAQGATVYNPSLATMTLCLAMSAFGSNVGGETDYSNKYQNAAQLLTEIGFEDIEANADYKAKPGRDTIGVIVAHKEIELDGSPKTVIALAIRGGGYEAEWGANFKVGDSGNHEGFSAASIKAHDFLADYIEEHTADFEDETVLWMTGYSRAAATTNLLAGKITVERWIGGVSFDSQDIYAYCFATPRGRMPLILELSDYLNIHNIINPYDLVTKVAPANWYFSRYGVDESVIPGSKDGNEEYFDAMRSKFVLMGTEFVDKSLVPGKDLHVLEEFKSKKLNIFETDEDGKLKLSFTIEEDGRTMSEFLNSLITVVANGFGDRETYAAQLQGAISTVVAEVMGKGSDADKWKEVPACISVVLKERATDIISDYLFVGYDEAEATAYECICEGILAAGIDINSPYYESLSPTTFSAALDAILNVVLASLVKNGFDDLVTLFEYYGILGSAHYPELYLSWMQVQDPNYGGTPVSFASAYRTVRINSDVNVNVYDQTGALVAQIVDDTSQEFAGSKLSASVNAAGEKELYLPSDESYDIEIVAVADGELDYSIGEYSYYTGSQSKLVNYYDVPVKTGDIIEGFIPEFTSEDTLSASEGSELDYRLHAAEPLSPDRELIGKAASEAFHTVSAVNDNPEQGNVIGGGVYSEGAYALVYATANENHEFIGWYDGDNLVFAGDIYEFRVERDTVITARFR